MKTDNRLLSRAFILSNLDQIIKESIYYRTHSEEFENYQQIVVGNARQPELRAKLI